jgi:adenylate cyclase class 2
MPLIEIEVKFYIENYEKIIKKIKLYSDNFGQEGFEHNILYDTNSDFLRKNHKLLRVRNYLGQTILTFKQPAKENSLEFKKLEETEVIVNSFDNLSHILINSGFTEKQIYEKKRQIFSKGSLEICVDRLPFGDFIELEGSESDIKSAAQSLNLNWDRKILPDYRTIFEKIKKEHRLLFNDITFKNFSGLDTESFSKVILDLCL